MPLSTLLGQCVAMAAASLAVGSLPLVLKSSMSARALSAVQVVGMGLLVGAALAIIIPEGASAMYAADDHSTHAIGLSLLSGFALMLLVENVCPHPPHSDSAVDSDDDEEAGHVHDHSHGHDHSHSHSHSHAHSHGSNGRRHSQAPMLPKEAEPECHSHAAAHGMSATLGLVIHGIADGIALGASSLSGSAELGLVVFLAVLVHKGPAALGLTTTLLSLHLSPAQVRRRLIVFSLAAPFGALLTYLAVNLFGHGNLSGLQWWTGAVLLFSGGSFLYVATVIQPISETGPDDHCHDVHHEIHKAQDAPRLPNLTRTGLILLGMALPALLALIVGDH